MAALLPVPHQLRLAQQSADRAGGRVAWVLIDTQAMMTLAEPHPLRPQIQITLAWAEKGEADRYRRRLNLPPSWRLWPTSTPALDAGAKEETKLGRPCGWAWKRDETPPRTQLDYISPYTGEVRRGWWGQPAPAFSDEISINPAPAEWSLDRAAHSLGQWMKRGARE